MHGRHRPSAATPPSPPAVRPTTRWLLLLLSVAQLMVILDISAVNVALPDLGKDLNIAQGDIGWTITSYSVVFGSLLLFGGRAADVLGRRHMFLTGLGVFTASSLITAVAGDAGMVFAARGGQGLPAPRASPAAARGSAPRCCRRRRCRSSPPRFTTASAPRRSASGARSAAPAPRSACCSA